MAQAMFRIYLEDRTPFYADPRYVLERALEPLYKMNLKIVMATELEFHLLDANSASPTPGIPLVPGVGVPQPGTQVYSPEDLWEVEDFLNDIYAYCEAQGILADAATSEYAQGQFEINLRHVDDPVLACDHAVLLKRAVKAAAGKHGYVACFMAKPFEQESGSGLHIHMSLVDRNGKNYFSQGKESLASPPFSARLRHAVGGLLHTMAEGTAIFSPNANPYLVTAATSSSTDVPSRSAFTTPSARSISSGTCAVSSQSRAGVRLAEFGRLGSDDPLKTPSL